jgi:hypothetical protein
MNKSVRFAIIIYLFINCLMNIKSEETDLTLDTISNYKQWGWEALVINNKYITVAIVPSMGGNILQYDFGIDTFLLLNPSTFSQLYETSAFGPFDNGSWGFGGFEIWPTPESWPPPPYLTYRKYSYIVETATKDSITILLKSEKETTTFSGLKFERRVSCYNNSTRVKIENTIINFNTKTVNYGMMNVTEVLVNHGNLNDYDNFSAYFPVNQSSKFSEGVYYKTKSTAFLGQLNPGIYTVDYKPRQGKVFADVNNGWTCFVDKKDNQAYARIFDVFEGESYPDNGARFEIYIEDIPNFMAIEALCPLKQLAANGGQYTFVDNLYSTRLNGPIFRTTHAGAVMERLKYDSINNLITGKFGVFNKGTIHLSYYDIEHNLLGIGDSFLVDPDITFVLNLTVSLPNKTNFIKLSAYDINNEFVDILDYKDFSEKELVNAINIARGDKTFMLINNIIKQNRFLNYQINNSKAGNISIDVYDFTGKKMVQLYQGYLRPGIYNWQYQISCLNTGAYFVIFSSDKERDCEKIIVIE